MALKRQLTAIIEREGDGYVALCPEIDVASQGDSIEQARQNLAEAIELFFETADPSEVEGRLQEEVFVTRVEVAIGWAPGILRPVALPLAGRARVRAGSTARKSHRHAEAYRGTTVTVPVTYREVQGMKNVTLSADEKLIEAAHKRARAEHTTLNEQFRRWLADYAQRQQRTDEAMAVVDRLRNYVRTGGRKFTRDEMNER
jgi:predicted RNase H-like HicB family nuclease